MRLRPVLLLMLVRGPLFAAVPLGLLMGLTVLLPQDVLRPRDLRPLMILILLAATFAVSLFGNAHRYAMTRGFASACVWSHAVVAGLIVLLVTLVPPTLVLWTGFRSFFQEHVEGNPYYPLMAPTEMFLPVIWFGVGVLLLTVGLFARVRGAQCARGRDAAPLYFAAMVLALLTIAISIAFTSGWRLWLIVAASAVVAAGLLVASRYLHRSQEVPS